MSELATRADMIGSIKITSEMEVAPRYKLPPLLKLLKLLKKLWSKKASVPVSYTIWLCCCMGSEQKTGDD